MTNAGCVTGSFRIVLFISLFRRNSEGAERLTDEFMKNEIYKTDNPIYAMEGDVVNVPCIPPGIVMSSMRSKVTHQWQRAGIGIIVDDTRVTTLESGELQIRQTERPDNGIYLCQLTASAGLVSRMLYKHTIIVYHVPKFMRMMAYYYIASACDKGLINTLHLEIQALLCGTNTSAASSCEIVIYKGDCKKNRGTKYSINVNLSVDPESTMKPPICEPNCIKNSYVMNLKRDNIEKLLGAFEKMSEDIIPELTGFKMDFEATKETILMSCPGGFIVYKSLLCFPCPQGYYRMTDQATGCNECGYKFYNPKFYATTCIPCPGWGQSDYRANPDVKLCRPFYKTWQGIVLISLVAVAILAAAFLILLHGGFMPYLYQPDFAKKSTKKKEMSQELKKLVKHYDPSQEEEEKQEKKRDESLADRTNTMKNARWNPGIGWQ